MKRTTSLALAAVAVLSFSAMVFAQQTTKTTDKKQATAPVKNEQKAAMEQKATMSSIETVQLNKEEIIALQNALIKAKTYKGKASGMLDMSTKDAIRSYQKANKLKVTGEPNQETLHKLGVHYTTPTVKPATQSMEHPMEMKKEAEQKPR